MPVPPFPTLRLSEDRFTPPLEPAAWVATSERVVRDAVSALAPMRAWAPSFSAGSCSARPANFSRKARIPVDAGLGSGFASAVAFGVSSGTSSSLGSGSWVSGRVSWTMGGGGGRSSAIRLVSRSGISVSSQGSGSGRSIQGSVTPSRSPTRSAASSVLRKRSSSSPPRLQGIREARSGSDPSSRSGTHSSFFSSSCRSSS